MPKMIQQMKSWDEVLTWEPREEDDIVSTQRIAQSVDESQVCPKLFSPIQMFFFLLFLYINKQIKNKKMGNRRTHFFSLF